MKRVAKRRIEFFIIIIVIISASFFLSNRFNNQNLGNSELFEFGTLNTKAPDETHQFGQLVGKWDCVMSSLNTHGVWQESKAEWNWKYILNGYAVQDYWFRKADKFIDSSSTNDYYGTNIRVYDPKKKKWACSWTENGNNTMSGLWTAQMNKDSSMVLYDDTKNWEITFFNIKKESFNWKWDYKQKDSTMKTMVKIKATRKK